MTEPTRRIEVQVTRPVVVLCKSCGADIVWGKTQNGRACPADARPVAGKYYSHFETCPNAQRHSTKLRPKKKAQNTPDQPQLMEVDDATRSDE